MRCSLLSLIFYTGGNWTHHSPRVMQLKAYNHLTSESKFSATTLHNFSINMPDMAWAENNQPNWQAAYRPQLALEPCGNYDRTHSGLIMPPDTDHRSLRAHPFKGTPHITRGDFTRRADGEWGELDGSLSSFLSFRKYYLASTSSVSSRGQWETLAGSAP